MVRFTVEMKRRAWFHPSECAGIETRGAEDYIGRYRRRFGSDAWIEAALAKYDDIARQNVALDAAGVA